MKLSIQVQDAKENESIMLPDQEKDKLSGTLRIASKQQYRTNVSEPLLT